jgi:hypothetical protein
VISFLAHISNIPLLGGTFFPWILVNLLASCPGVRIRRLGESIVELYHVVLPHNAVCCIYCDSKAALARVQDNYYEGFGTTWSCRTHYDLEAAIRQCLQQLPISFSWQWVRGHAGRRKEPHGFTFAETLNETADDLATTARNGRALDHDDDHWAEQVISVIGHRRREHANT